MFSCPYGDRNDLPSKEALRKHVARHKRKAEPISSQRQTEREEPVSQINEKITNPYSDEWDCAVCLHRFSSLASAQDHYRIRHIDKIPYSETDQKESIQIEKQSQVEIQDLNDLAHKRAAELSQSLYAHREGIVKQQLFPIAEPQIPIVEPREEPKQERPNTEKPQSEALVDAFKKLGNLLKGQNRQQKPEPERQEIFMAFRGVGVDGVNASISTQPYFCKTENRYLSWNEYLMCKSLGHEGIYANE
jgi:hypothetical protein